LKILLNVIEIYVIYFGF